MKAIQDVSESWQLSLWLLAYILWQCCFCLIWFTNKKTSGVEIFSKRKEQWIKIPTVLFISVCLCMVIQSKWPSDNPIVDGLAILGVVIAIASWREAVEQNEEIKDISNSLPTRYIGPFPDHLDDIIELVEKAQNKFCIMTDCVDYGSFSHPEKHNKLIQKIVYAINLRGIDVQMVVSKNPAPISRSSPYFRKKFEDLCELPEFEACLKRYLCYYPKFRRPSEDKKFKNILKCHHRQIDLLLDVAGAIITYGSVANTGLFIWMRDDLEAVFLLSRTGIGTQGLAFRTRDAKLIEIFKSTFDEKSKPSQK
jgi:hypothetical protein